jgi:hypothetical protein
MRFEDAVRAVEDTIKKTGIRPTKEEIEDIRKKTGTGPTKEETEDTRKKASISSTEEEKYAIYLNYTTKALTLHRIEKNSAVRNYENLPGYDYLVAKNINENGRPSNDFWIVYFPDFPTAFTFFICLLEILRCSYGERFAFEVNKNAKPTPSFPF